ncbi:MAG: GDSL-type esterase/lipase family protein [Pseudomonadota bacterium]
MTRDVQPALLLPLLCTWVGCQRDPGPWDSTPGGPIDSTADSGDTAPRRDTGEGEDHCTEVEAFAPVYADTIETWTTQDDLAPWPEAPLVLVGSSSVRRWEGFAQAYSDHTPLQRGFGGAQLGEVALSAQDLVIRHDPRAVLVYAGTNDVDAGVPGGVVVERFRCLRQRIGRALGGGLPVLFIGITPNPARWSQWEEANAVNSAVAALAASDAGVSYVDVPSAFLATGSPPDAALFVEDGLHLSAEGYALWNSVLRPAVESVTSPTPTGGGGALPAGTRVLVDLGPSNAEDGEPSPSPDYLGQHWNNWYAVEGDQEILPGEHLDDLVDDAGAATFIDLVITGGFSANGRSHGGLLWPDPGLLGDLAVGSATGDFFYCGGDDRTGGLFLRGLDPQARYTLRLFAARDDAERRITRYTVSGATSSTAELQTSGAGAGSDGGQTNDHATATFAGVQPDPWGHVFLDVAQQEGSYAYLSLLELAVER